MKTKRTPPKKGAMLWCTWDMNSFQEPRPTMVKVKKIVNDGKEFIGDIYYSPTVKSQFVEGLFHTQDYNPKYSVKRAGAQMNTFDNKELLAQYCIDALSTRIDHLEKTIKGLKDWSQKQ